MLQWVPGTQSEVMWNERAGDRFVCRIHDLATGRSRVLPQPIYSLSPDGRWGVSPDFRRLNDCRPDYGYAGIPEPGRDNQAPDDAGIWKTDTVTGDTRLIVTFREIFDTPYEGDETAHAKYASAKHWFNHLLFNTDGSRFLWLHRWRPSGAGPNGFITRMFTAATDGSDRFILDPLGRTSHFVWRDPNHVFAWAWHPSHQERFYLFKDKSRKVTPVAPDLMTENGHNTYLPGTNKEWILNDTYPGADSTHHVYLYHAPTHRRIPVADLPAPLPYRGEWRCDCQMYLINIADVFKS